MLALKINNTPLDLGNDISITLKFLSPIFNTIGDHSYPFKIPATPRNMQILGWKHRIENSNDLYEEFDAVLEWEGVMIERGNLRVKKANSQSYEATLYMNKGDFYYQRRNISMQAVDFGEVVFSTILDKINYINGCTNKVYPEVNFAFPQILNDSYFSEPPAIDELRYFNPFAADTIHLVTPPSTRNIIVPMLYLRYVLKKIFEHLNFEFDDSFFSADTDYNSLAIFNLVDCNNEGTGYFEYDDYHIFSNYHVPRMTITEFFSALESFFNIRFFVDNVTSTVKLASVDKIIKSTDYIEFSKQIISLVLEVPEQINGYSFKMTMDTEDPLWTLFKEAEDTFINYIKPSVQSVADLPPWPASTNFEIRFVRDEKVYYILYDKVWAISPMENISMWSQFVYKETGENISTKCSTLVSRPENSNNCEVGNARENWKEVSLKLFFSFYQDLGAGNRKMVGRNFTNTKSLFYKDDNGLFSNHYKTYCDFMMRVKPVSIIKKMTFIEMKDLDFSKKYMINGIKYLLSQVQVSISNEGIKPATIKALNAMEF